MELCINADDFGISKEVNEAIKVCFDREYITNTTIMVNMPYTDEAVNIAFQSGFFRKVGLHLNLTKGEPLTEKIKGNPLFCDKNGMFNGCFHSNPKNRMFLFSGALEGLKEEITAQFTRYKAFGFSENHMDSHHHVHTDLSILKTIIPIFQENDFSSMRLLRNIGFNNAFSPRQIYKTLINQKIRYSVPHFTDAFGDFDDYLGNNRLSEYFTKYATIELMCHPIMEVGNIINGYARSDITVSFEKIEGYLKGCKKISYSELKDK